jgi:hypothetical protein
MSGLSVRLSGLSVRRFDHRARRMLRAVAATTTVRRPTTVHRTWVQIRPK